MNIEVSAIGSLTDFARNTKKHTAELLESGQPRLLTQNGEAMLVVQSAEEYEKMAALAHEREMDEQLRRGLEQIANGDEIGVPVRETFDRIREKFGVGK